MMPNWVTISLCWGRADDMAENAYIRARIDEEIKNEASLVLAQMGLTLSDFVRITVTRVARDKVLPFDVCQPCVPNKITADTLSKSERGEDIYRARDEEDLFKQLGI